ncbi:unnamed protein product [Durusdinium trenchii]|uniref:Uncharacterized protein n=1 Tax=Durusdinium trenchii TaxID=1381693 RepID=A0ABP0MWF0_9DINO
MVFHGVATCWTHESYVFWYQFPWIFNMSQKTRSGLEAREIEAAGRTFLESYQNLNRMSIRRSELCWTMIPKWHAMAEMLQTVVREQRLTVAVNFA